uniref:DUF3615 domain-containing protein n=1 Tax=Oryza punctata TaxID=4537 RepID=A0A0E0L7F4_ORYPU
MWYSDPPSRMRSYDCIAILVGRDVDAGPFPTSDELYAALYDHYRPRSKPSDPAPPPLPSQCEDHVGGTSYPGSAHVLQEPDVLSLGELLDATTLKESITCSPSSSPQAVSEDTINSSPSVRCLSSPGSIIWVREPPEDRLGEYHIRMDRSGSFHTYPDLSGPFHSLNEAEDAISSHLNRLYPPVKPRHGTVRRSPEVPSPSMAPPPRRRASRRAGRERVPCADVVFRSPFTDEVVRLYSDSRGYFASGRDVDAGPFPTSDELYAALYDHYRPRSKPSDPAPPPLPSQCEDHVGGTSYPGSAHVLQEPDVLSLGELLDATTLKESITCSPSSSPQAVSEDTINSSPSVRCLSSPGSIIWVREPPEDRLGEYHIRMDRSGSFHTYPDLSGPFHSLNEAEDAISSHLNRLYPPVKFQERAGESYVDKMIRKELYWPDGTRKKCSKAQAFENVKNTMNQLAKVILDMYNDDHNLLEDLSYELKEVVNFEPIFESHRWFDHINFTANTKGSKGLDRVHLFFAEAMSLEGQKDYVVTCCSLISSDDNGNCYTCKIGNKSMKHPSDVNSYVGGHCYITGIYDTVVSSDSEEDEDAEEQRLREMYQDLDDPGGAHPGEQGGSVSRVRMWYSDPPSRMRSYDCIAILVGRDVDAGPFPTSDELYAALYDHYRPRSKPSDPAPPPLPSQPRHGTVRRSPEVPSPSMAPPPRRRASRRAGRERVPWRDVDAGPFPTSDELYAALYDHYRPRSKPSDPAPPPLPSQCEDHVGGTSYPGSAHVLQEPDVLSLGELLDATTLKESITCSPSSSPQAVSEDTINSSPSVRCLSSPGSIIWVREPPEDRLGEYHIRMDRSGSFHTYPDLGGPFHSLNEAEDAISSHLNRLYPPVKFQERAGESYVDKMIREKLYWPDGTRKKCSKAQAFQNVKNTMNQLAKVILDMYNDDHNLLEDLSYEFKEVVHFEPIFESHRWFDHINFTANTKGSKGLDRVYLFFAEAMSLEGQKDYVVTCCSLISSDDNGNCYTCKIGNKSMKHPSNVNSYVGGHCYITGIYDMVVSSDSEEDEDAEEQRLRKMYQDLDDPGVWEELFD